MVELNWRATLAGFLGGAVVLGVLLWVIGIDRVLEAMVRANLVVVAFVGLVALVWLSLWGLALRTVLAVSDVRLSLLGSFLVYTAATFANNVTPFGQAGGEPFSALLIARVTDTEYETGLAAIASVDALNFLPSIGLAILGLGYFATTATLGDQLVLATASVATLTVVLIVGTVLGWQYRYRLEGAVVRVVMPVVVAVGAAIPKRKPPSTASVERRIEGFFHTIERIASDRRQLLVALGLSTAGWVALSSCLWLSLWSLGHPVPIAAPLVAIPLGAITSVTPLPGALGALETVQIALLVPITGLAPTTVGAAVLIHRGATYWLPVLIGGSSVIALGARRR